MTGNRPKLSEFFRYINGKRVFEILLKPKKSCRYYWKAQIRAEGNSQYRVQFFDRFGKPYGAEPNFREDTAESTLFKTLEEAKIHSRRTLLNQ